MIQYIDIYIQYITVTYGADKEYDSDLELMKDIQ